jgi:hypothetical protein
MLRQLLFCLLFSHHELDQDGYQTNHKLYDAYACAYLIVVDE